jgi:hypothetical protein
MPGNTLALQAEQRIMILRDQKVMLDFHLAELYGVETRALKQDLPRHSTTKPGVRRNPERFPADFMFELTPEEARLLVSQTVIPGLGKLGGAERRNPDFHLCSPSSLQKSTIINRQSLPFFLFPQFPISNPQCPFPFFPWSSPSHHAPLGESKACANVCYLGLTPKQTPKHPEADRKTEQTGSSNGG